MITSSHHSFDISLASEFGIEEAIIIHHFQHWIRVNKKLNKNTIEGRTWTYQTIEEIAAHFPYLSFARVRYAISNLIRANVLMSGNYNKMKFDRTVWYAFVNEGDFIHQETGREPCNSKKSYDCENSQMEVCKFANGDVRISTPIPDTKTDARTDKKETRKKGSQETENTTLEKENQHTPNPRGIV